MIAGLLILFSWGTIRAESPTNLFRLTFEGEEVAAEYGSSELRALVRQHQRTTDDLREGKSCEQILFLSPRDLPEQRITLPVPPARVFDELTASLWVRSNSPMLRLAVRVRFPHQRDPRTGAPLSMELAGDACTRSSKWQRLECRTSDARLTSRLIRLRGQLNASGAIDTREPYVDQVVLLFQVPKGESGVRLDDLQFGPIVPPNALAGGEEEAPPRAESPLAIVDDRILKQGEPFFPVFTIYHGESLEALAASGVNLLWVPDYTDPSTLSALTELDIGAIAQPPQPSPEQAVLRRAGIPTFSEATAPVWAWILGYDIPIDDQQYVSAWAEQVRDADRGFKRPILADVSGNERSFHRSLDLLGSSQATLHTTVSTADHFGQLRRRRDLALPGKPMFTFVQTEAAAPLLDHVAVGGSAAVVEPEQILHQAYAALAAGYKGVGFWKQVPLDSDLSGLNERMHAIRIFAAHCHILESWLASGRVSDVVAVRTESEFNKSNAGKVSPLTSRWDRPVTLAADAGGGGAHEQTEIRATVLQCDRGLLILPVWYQPGAQWVPGPQSAQGIRFLVHGDYWQAWEVTPTGLSQSNLELSVVPGGTEFHLKNFNQQTAVIVTNDPSAIEELNRRSRQVRGDAARACVALAQLKYERVQGVHEKLKGLDPQVPQAEPILRRSHVRLQEANRELAKGHDDDARRAGEQTLLHLRSLQRSYWDSAVAPLKTVTTSLPASSFQTLPDHWQLLADMGRARNLSGNLLPSGGFEDEEVLSRLWRDGSHAAAQRRLQLRPGGPQGRSHLSLSLESAPNSPSHPLVLISPELTVAAGEIVVITGQFQIPQTLIDGEGLLIFDTVTGRQGGGRYREATSGWQTFKLIRRFSRESPLRIRFELHGGGSVQLDDVRVHTLAD